jgi:hypothetical protein
VKITRTYRRRWVGKRDGLSSSECARFTTNGCAPKWSTPGVVDLGLQPGRNVPMDLSMNSVSRVLCSTLSGRVGE